MCLKKINPKRRDSCFLYQKKNGDYYDFIFGVVTGVDGRKVGITGVIVNPVGLKNKIEQGKTGERSQEILDYPSPKNIRRLCFIFLIKIISFFIIVMCFL